MYTLRYIGIPREKRDLDGVWALLVECDRDFVPRLSERNSTSQSALAGLSAPEDALPYAYFEEIKTQHLIAAYDETGRMAAFMSFKTGYTCEALSAFGPMIYASTACVHHEDRGHGLLKGMYTLLEEQLPGDVPGQKRANLVHRAYDAARAGGESVSQVRVNLGDVDQEVYIVNSEGLMVGDRRVYTRMGISVVASDGKENQTGFVGPGAMMGYELFETRVDVERAAREAARTACVMLSADQCPAGVMPVVIDGGFGGVIFHEACGHSLEATAVARGNSEFCGKMGKQVASPIVTAIDDGTIANEWGSLNIDDEGTPTTRLVLIEKGILKNYMIDKLNGRRMNMPVTGSARRQSYSFAPTSRMRNTFIAPGEHDEDEIIRTMGDGLYARQMGGGSVNPATGEFNFAVTEGYLVKDGKIDRPVRGATLIGKGSEVLMRIDRVGKKMWMAQGVCGSVSGSVNTNVGQPMIRVTQMTVGGR